MITPHKPDYILLGTALILVVFGLMMISSASIVIGQENFGDPYYYFRHQLFNGLLVSLPALGIIQAIHYKHWKKWSVIFLGLTLIGLILLFIPNIGYGYGGARRWISLGPFSLQPAEIAKLTFIIYLAAWLEKRKEKIRDFSQGFAPFLLVTAVIGTLIALQPDISTLGIIAISATIVYFLAGAKISHIILIFLGGLGVLWGLIKMAPYRMSRLTVFLHPEIDPQGIGYQINQALLALGSGGLLGLGLGHSRQKFLYLPEPVGDSIFAIIGEELGFVGVLFLMVLFLVVAVRGFRIAKNAPCLFGKLVAGGITSWIVIQAFINIAALSGLIPLTGIPLPFISYGGSALVISLVGMGIVLNISRWTVE